MLISRLRQASESFWVLPAALGLLAVVVAELMLTVDRDVVGDGVWVFADLSPDGSRSLLTTVGGSMLGVAATSFSITISVLATTSSTYGPRLVRNFMADRGNQLVLAVLTSSFVYCLVVLRAVRGDADGVSVFVPTVAVHVAVLIALLDVAVLVYFIHHIASSVQVTSLQERVRGELDEVVAELYPADADEARSAPPPGLADGGRRVTSSASGYVCYVALPRLVRWAAEHDAVVEVVAAPGTWVVAGDTLARAVGSPDDADTGPVEQAFTLGPGRSPHQDAAYAVQQLTEMAVRALSPGTNDPYTAIGALDALTPGLVTVCSRPRPPLRHLDEDGQVRAVLPVPQAHELTRPVLAAIRTWGTGDTDVVVAALGLAARLLDATPAGSDRLREVIGEEAGALVDAYRDGDPHPVDDARVQAAADRLPVGS